MIKVLGIDVASSAWASNGSAVLGFERDAEVFTLAQVPALSWPNRNLSASALAKEIDSFVRREGIVAVSLDGPQGWRDPRTSADLPGVGRRCEYECRTQGKTGVYPITYPGTQRPWIEFCIDLFETLLAQADVSLACAQAAARLPSDGYIVLECFPTSAWRSSGLEPLPGKSRRPSLAPFVDRLSRTFGIPISPDQISSHDDLQALVAAVTAAACVGGPAVSIPRGRTATRSLDGGRLLEGLIWDVKPLRQLTPPTNPAGFSSQLPLASATGSMKPKRPSVRVTQKVLAQVSRIGFSQAQIALQGFPHGSKEAPDVPPVLSSVSV